MLDPACSAPLWTEVLKLFKPGGWLLFFESNPWSAVFQMCKRLGKLLPVKRRGDERPNKIGGGTGFARRLSLPFGPLLAS